MTLDRDRLFDLDVWRPALTKYEAVTHLTVTLYDADAHVICCDPLKPDTLFALFRESGCLPGVLSECARHCLNDTNAHDVVVSTAGIVGVVGTPLVLEQKRWARQSRASQWLISANRHLSLPSRGGPTLEDDGVGFDLALVDRERPNATMGIRSIRERVELIHGTVEIETAAGQGTTVIVTVPLPGPSRPVSG